jgi:hypothetical protein
MGLPFRLRPRGSRSTASQYSWVISSAGRDVGFARGARRSHRAARPLHQLFYLPRLTCASLRVLSLMKWREDDLASHREQTHSGTGHTRISKKAAKISNFSKN